MMLGLLPREKGTLERRLSLNEKPLLPKRKLLLLLKLLPLKSRELLLLGMLKRRLLRLNKELSLKENRHLHPLLLRLRLLHHLHLRLWHLRLWPLRKWLHLLRRLHR